MLSLMVNNAARVRQFCLVVLFVGIQPAFAGVDSITYGSPARTITGSLTAINRLPQKINVAVTYTGSLDVNKWISMVDATSNGGDPCGSGANAAAAASDSASGSLQANTGTKEVTMQSQGFLSESITFAVCYASAGGDTFDTTWADSNIRLQMSKIATITPQGGTAITTTGTMTPSSTQQLEYNDGALGPGKWLSLVLASLNSNEPCAAGAVAAQAASTQSSGPIAAGGGTRTITGMNTNGLTTDVPFAVCYAEVDGTATDSWADSGIRITLPAPPTSAPTAVPTATPTSAPTAVPTTSPTAAPTAKADTSGLGLGAIIGIAVGGVVVIGGVGFGVMTMSGGSVTSDPIISISKEASTEMGAVP